MDLYLEGEKLRITENDEGIRIENFYDSEGNLIQKIVSNDGTVVDNKKYLVDNNNLTGYSQIVCEIDVESDKVIKYNTFTEEIKSQSLANSNNPFYLHTDALGSIRSLTSEGVSEQYDYTAFGSKLAGSGSLTDYAFTGQLLDYSSGLQYHRARLLDAGLGRWVSKDRLFDFKGNYGNTYSYVGNNPVNFSDPSGLTTYFAELGKAIHRDIQARCKKQLSPPNEILPNQRMPYGLIFLIPDIIDFTAAEIYEIKPLSVYGLTGFAQLELYLQVANALGFLGITNYKHGTLYNNFGIYGVPDYPGKFYVELGNFQGVILYYVFNFKRFRANLEALEKRIDEILRHMKDLLLIASAAALGFIISAIIWQMSVTAVYSIAIGYVSTAVSAGVATGRAIQGLISLNTLVFRI